MTAWKTQRTSLKYQLSDLTLFTAWLPLQVRSIPLAESVDPVDTLSAPAAPLPDASEGFCLRVLPVARAMPPFSKAGDFLCYVSASYRHYYIDLDQPFERYEAKFSAKSRSTIKRKIRKFAEHCGGTIDWRTYREPADMAKFLSLAREISRKTYQERLLDAGIPDSAEFAREAEDLAARGKVRAYILSDAGRPVSYLYCPVIDDTLIYAYLGYDPDYARLSVGTVLQWLAVEQIFAERRFRYFDFTEGESEHKRLFATNERACVNVFFLRRSLRNSVLVHSHRLTCGASKMFGNAFERIGVKAKVKALLRSMG